LNPNDVVGEDLARPAISSGFKLGDNVEGAPNQIATRAKGVTPSIMARVESQVDLDMGKTT